MFVDEARITVHAGRGGDGCVSFRREKFRPRGGPDGGSGGKGGDVVLESSESRATLLELHKRSVYRAKSGRRGGSNNRRGASGESLVIMVPPGTLVMDDEGRALADLVQKERRFVAARGGRGGRGNASLVGEAGPLPGFAEKGEPGETRTLNMELRLVADVAIVGLPNAGKSTLISRISGARPKIADYPFTTTEPNLGVVEGGQIDFVVTDVPGLVKGAHEGKGMGVDFLRHVERARLIVFLVDMSPYSGRDPVDDLRLLEGELGLFDPEILGREKLVAANKMDLGPSAESLAELGGECERRGVELVEISAVTGQNIGGFTGRLEKMVADSRKHDAGVVTDAVLAPAGLDEETAVYKRGDRFVLRGQGLERMVQMTDWDNREARDFLARRLRGSGVEDLLDSRGAERGDEVEIAGRVFTYSPEEELLSENRTPGVEGGMEDGSS